MKHTLFHIDRYAPMTLQNQIQEKMVSAILNGTMIPGAPVPSTRMLASKLKVSRNTVSLAYEALASEGYLVSHERSGFFVADDIENFENFDATKNRINFKTPVDISDWLIINPTAQYNIKKPENWHEYPFPFIYGQSDPSLFPFQEWRECTRQAVSRKLIESWTEDSINQDDSVFIQQIRQRVLPRRGINAAPEEILVTLGAQNAIYLIVNLCVNSETWVGIEDPGYPDARNILALNTNKIYPLPLDEKGVIINDKLKKCHLIYITPSHQMPTNVTLGQERRKTLLKWAFESNRVIIEDDYEFETNYLGTPTPALKSLDKYNRVLYVGSLSKSLVPGLRIGFLVGPREFIEEARALRRLMFRHPPGNNQRLVAQFLAMGHHNTLIGRLHRTYSTRWQLMKKALNTHLPGWAQDSGFGGTAIWIRGPNWLDSKFLAECALEFGVIIESGHVFFASPPQKCNYFRLGFSSIPTERIEPGIKALAQAAKSISKNRNDLKP